MKRNIGKNTLGDGNKMSVELHNYNRSTQNLGYIWRNTQTVGTLVPFMCEIGQRGDTHNIALEANVLTHPTVGPLFGSFKLQADVFVCPIRLYNGWLHNNKIGVGMDMKKIKLPQLEVGVNIWDNPYFKDIDGNINNTDSQINPSCLLSYLGLNGYGTWDGIKQPIPEELTVQKNATPLIAYFDIFKNFYANKQEENAYMMGQIKKLTTVEIDEKTYQVIAGSQIWAVWPNNTQCTLKGSFDKLNQNELNEITFILRDEDVTNPKLFEMTIEEMDRRGWNVNSSTQEITITNYYDKTIRIIDITKFPTKQGTYKFELEQIDNLREEILYHNNASPFIINKNRGDIFGTFALRDGTGGEMPALDKLLTTIPQYGLLLKTYNSDLFNNWINTEWIDQITSISAISTSAGSFTIDALNMAQKIYAMMNRVAISGGSYQDWLETVYTDDYFQKTETPIYMGGMSQEVIFQEVISNAATAEEPLGTLAGRGKLAPNKKGGHLKIKIDEPSYIIGIVSLTPRIDYSQGNRYDTDFKTLDDLHKPALDGIGFEDLTLDKMWWGARSLKTGTVKSIGKQPAWINYKTNFNKTHGNFAAGQDEAFMVLNRNYKVNENSISNIEDATTYIDPEKYNYIFADTSLYAMNYWIQIGVENECRRLISASNIPNL